MQAKWRVKNFFLRSLLTCAGVQFSHDSICIFNERIKVRGLWRVYVLTKVTVLFTDDTRMYYRDCSNWDYKNMDIMWEKIIESLQLLGLNCDGDAEDPMSLSKRIYILPTNLAIIQIYSVCLSLSELSQKWLFQTLFTYKINNSPVQLITAFGGMDSLRAGSLVWIGYRGQRWESRNRELARRMGRGKVKTTIKATHSNTNPWSGQ